MTGTLTWVEIGQRLALAILAGGLIGLNRGEHGLAAGLRTTLLVCLAACLSMIQANILMASAGKPGDSFVTIDLMRLPLGILSGMGFIGGGVILKRGSLVLGVTTAATLWFVTVLGLCFGGGQIALGLIGLAIGVVVLRYLKSLEFKLKSVRRGTLTVGVTAGGPTEREVRSVIQASKFEVVSSSSLYSRSEGRREFTSDIRWWDYPQDSDEPSFLKALEQLSGVDSLKWSPQGF